MSKQTKHKAKIRDRLKSRDSEELRKLRFKEGDVLYSLIELNYIVVVKKVLTKNPEHELGNYLVKSITIPYMETKMPKFILYKPNGIEAALLRKNLKSLSWKIRHFIGEYILCSWLVRKAADRIEKRINRRHDDNDEED